ncbi:MAG: gluconate 2-dehydrogenase subunit 3 family protein, partial [Natrialbaceae archaeon]
MELTRRDAVAALAALGGVGATPFAVSRIHDDPRRTEVSDERVRETFRAVAAVVYPSELSGVDRFVEEFLDGRLAGDTHAAGIREAVALLDERAENWHGARVSELPPETRDRLLREVGADTADERPDGSDAERVRYFVF